MNWKQEIIRALLLALGSFEVITNMMFLARNNGLKKARKQHTELPPAVTDKQLKVKVICMLSFGIVLFSVSLLSYILHTYLHLAIIAALALFVVYGITEALYYRYWKTFGFATVTIVFFVIAAFL